MTAFTNRPPVDPRGTALPLIRTPAFRTLRAIVTSDDLLGTFTHYWKGRTLPCDQEQCLACKEGSPFRWHAWLSAYTAKPNQHILFEMTAKISEHFVLYRQANKTLRGCLFEAWRPSGKPNGRMCIKLHPADLTTISLPEGVNLLKVLSIIWNVNLPAIDLDRILEGVPHAHVQHEHSPITPNIDGNGRGR